MMTENKEMMLNVVLWKDWACFNFFCENIRRAQLPQTPSTEPMLLSFHNFTFITTCHKLNLIFNILNESIKFKIKLNKV